MKTLFDKLKQQLKNLQQTSEHSLIDPEREITVYNESMGEPYEGPALQVGDQLVITAETVTHDRRLDNVLGRVVIIDQLPSAVSPVVKASVFGIQVTVDKKLAERMRMAYLRREQTSS